MVSYDNLNKAMILRNFFSLIDFKEEVTKMSCTAPNTKPFL